MHHRRGLRRLLKDDALLESVEQDFESSTLDERRKAILRYASKLTLQPGRMAREDLDPLRNAGLSDLDMLHVAEVTAYYAYANRIADGLGVSLEPPA